MYKSILLNTDNEQERVLKMWTRANRWLYNQLLELCKEGIINIGIEGRYFWDIELVYLYDEVNKILMTPDYEWLNHVPTETLGNAVMDIYHDLKASNGEVSRYPVYKSGASRKNRVCYLSYDDIIVNTGNRYNKVIIKNCGSFEIDGLFIQALNKYSNIQIEKYKGTWIMTVHNKESKNA